MQADGLGKTLDSAKNFSISTGKTLLSDKVNPLEGGNFYKFSLGGSSSFNLTLDNLSADADVDLIQDANANNLIDRGEVIAYSRLGKTNAEAININLDAGNYYIQVFPYGNAATDYTLSVAATPFDHAGNTLNTARKIAIDSQSSSFSDWVGTTDTNDYYKFDISTNSDLQLTLSNLSADADVKLLDAIGDIIASSVNLGSTNESITSNLDQGTYYVQVSSYSGETFYNLSLSANPTEVTLPNSTSEIVASAARTPQNTTSTLKNATNSVTETLAATNTTPHVKGTLKADTFTYQSGNSLSIFSGNGNVEFGSGKKDILDMSSISSGTVTFSPANTANGGVVYNPGNGNRLFDAITFKSDNSQILFEGIDTIKFADTTIDLSVVPNDPLFNQQWNLHMMDVQGAWRFTTGTNKILIGIEDTGLGTDANGNIHPDLRLTAKVDNNYADENATYSHGGLVGGIIAANSNNGLGIAGIDWNADIMQIDVVGKNPGDYDLAGATQKLIDQANSKGQNLVINLSLSGGNTPEFEKLVANNQDKVLFVFASGNEDKNTLASPANLALNNPNAVAVGASWGTEDWYDNPTNPGDRITYKDKKWWVSQFGNGLTLMAPSEVLTTKATRNSASNPFSFGYGGLYDRDLFTGTSAAAPNVTGVAALVWSVNPNLKATQVKEILSQTAYDLGAAGYDTEYGFGFVNADAAVRRAIALAKGNA